MASNFRIPSAAPSRGMDQGLIGLSHCASAPSTLLKPETTCPALAAMASASTALRTKSASVSAASVGVARMSRLKPLLKWLRLTASATAWRDAETHRPAAGKLALQIRRPPRPRRDHKPDQLVDRPHLPRDRAHPRRRGPVGPRSVVEIGISQGKHACDIAPVICADSGRRTRYSFCATRLSRLVFGRLGRLGAWQDRPR